MTRRERLHKRNDKVRNLFESLSKKHPQWRIEALINEVAKTMFLAPRTIEAILRGEGTYTDTSVKSNQLHLF